MRMSGLVGLIGVVLGVSSSSMAQPAVPYIGQVSVERVEVRSGAGRAYYAVGELRAGERVVVVDEFFNWYKIEAPAGVSSFVLKKDIDREGNGEVGVANTDRVDVNVADPTKGPDKSFRTHKSLSKGDRVQITGEVDRWYQIKPPQDAYVFLPPNTVSPAPGSEPAPAVAPVPTPTPAPSTDGGMVPAVVPAPTPEPAPAPPTPTVTAAAPVAPAAPADPVADDVAWDGNAPVTAPPSPRDAAVAEVDDALEDAMSTVPAQDAPPALAIIQPTLDSAISVTPAPAPGTTADGAAADATASAPALDTPAVSEALRRVEQQNLPLFDLPVDEQPIVQMRSAYETAGQTPDLPAIDQRLIEQRLAVLARNADVAATIQRIAKLRNSLPEYDPADIELPPDPSKGYAAVGTLAASTVFTGSRTPQMFRVVDPNTRGTIAYVRPVAGLDLTPHLGGIVGVVGQRQFDPTLNATLITVTKIDALTPAGQ